ncbi:MAG: cysteine desulfurase family protein, partial [bacterium]|nr:cysteine desulfurase family protein [bacterium]
LNFSLTDRDYCFRWVKCYKIIMIYLDHNATTPVDPRVREEMLPYLVEIFGNPSSLHSFGRKAKEAIEEARIRVAHLISANPKEIFFTSGGTEADNLAIRGIASYHKDRGKHIITTAIEHHAVLLCTDALEKEGFKITYIMPKKDGIVSAEDVLKAISKETILITIMTANNETGAFQPIKEIGRRLAEHNKKRTAKDRVYFHTDAVQAVGKTPFDVDKLQVDMVSLSGHKIYGPKGVGAIYIRQGSRISPITYGGQHENGMRPGTENVPGIVGFGRAAEIANSEFYKMKEVKRLRDLLERGILERIPDVQINGSQDMRLPTTTSISFSGVFSESLLAVLDQKGIAVSSGSACNSSSPSSHVLKSMELSKETMLSTLRFSLGTGNTEEEIRFVISATAEAVDKLR